MEIRKTSKMHGQDKIRKCHYYNNKKVCPFQNFGCKFLHEKAGVCRFKENCGKEMCQYEH